MKSSLLLIIGLFISFTSRSQDTTTIETLNFGDLTKRTGTYAFPDSGTFEKVLMYYTLKCDPATQQDQFNCGEWDYLSYVFVNDTTWIEDTFEVARIEIARYITPYGIGLDLGPEGFLWIYDVTDYASLLKGNLTVSAGNQQELIDLKFKFIKGIPPRNVKKIHYLANRESRQYRYIDSNFFFKEDTVSLLPDASEYKIITRITGHGHQGNSGGGQIHCCEWANKKHYLNINGERKITWDIWQNDKCALNPVSDQGGNWAPPRAGWCPGAPVDDYNFELGKYIGNDSVVRIDYAIEPVPASNYGQGTGNYVISLHLVEYDTFNHQYDASVEDIISPNNWEFYQRINPTCTRPKIRIMNRGQHTLSSLDITYGVVNGNPITYWWQGDLEFMEYEDIELPFNIWDWIGQEKRFYAKVENPNGKVDENPSNDRQEVSYRIPDVYKGAIEILYRNNRIEDCDVVITNDRNEVVYENIDGSGVTLSRQTLTLDPGCYKMYVVTENGFGLSYPLIPDIGTGLLRFIDKSTNQGPLFNGDFGKSFTYHFTVSYSLNETNLDKVASNLEIYPNPTDGIFVSELTQQENKPVVMTITDVSGRIIEVGEFNNKHIVHQFDLSSEGPGIYFLQVIGEGINESRKLIVE